MRRPQGRDLGGVAADIHKVIQDTAHDVPNGASVVLRGQVTTMTSAYQQLFVGLAFAIVLIYLLIVVNFQSWLDPFVIVMALPSALAGIVWMLFATGTTLSVPALTGAIMCMGVATANSILVISFARERLAAGADALAAALDAGSTRFRPVLMTALAMIIGMAPMAIEPGQNAPLGRAVIGGLLFATCATLFLVPTLFSLVHARDRKNAVAAHLRIQPIPRLTRSERTMSSDPVKTPESPPAPASWHDCPRRCRRYRRGRPRSAGPTASSNCAMDQRPGGPDRRSSPSSAAAAPMQSLMLPGNIQPYYKAAIYARVSGYLKSWQQDIGAHVKAGQVLASIDAPDLDQQLAQAQANLASAKANYDIAAITAQR